MWPAILPHDSSTHNTQPVEGRIGMHHLRRSIVFVKRLCGHKSALVGLIIILTVLLVAIIAPLISPHDPYSSALTRRLLPPDPVHRFGTDTLGRDILSRCIYGTRVSLQVGVISVSLSLTIGGMLGLLAGFWGGILDSIIMRVMDALLSFPAILLALMMVAALGPSLVNAMIAIGISSIPTFARLMRGQVLGILSVDYVVSARALGASNFWIMTRHILPNVISPLIVLATLRLATAIIIESSLSFLGLGVQPPTASWGSMVADGRKYILTEPWISLIPGLLIMVTVIGFNLLGDGMRDVLDPRLNNGEHQIN